jgi:Lrp/AsnC family transcriptional regulator, leucine-responsive regulatory protein
MTTYLELDSLDRAILEQLRVDGRRPAAEIGRSVNLSAPAVRKRIERLTETGVIRQFTVVLDHHKLQGSAVEAFIEVTFGGEADVPALLREAVRDSRIREASMIGGDPDALLRIRVAALSEVRDVVTILRERYPVVRTRALVALDRVRHDGSLPRIRRS